MRRAEARSRFTDPSVRVDYGPRFCRDCGCTAAQPHGYAVLRSRARRSANNTRTKAKSVPASRCLDSALPGGRAREGVLCAPMAPAGVRVELWDIKILNQTGRLSRGKPTPGRRSVSPRSPTEPPGTSPTPPAQNHTPHATDEINNKLTAASSPAPPRRPLNAPASTRQ